MYEEIFHDEFKSNLQRRLLEKEELKKDKQTSFIEIMNLIAIICLIFSVAFTCKYDDDDHFINDLLAG